MPAEGATRREREIDHQVLLQCRSRTVAVDRPFILQDLAFVYQPLLLSGRVAFASNLLLELTNRGRGLNFGLKLISP